MATWPAPVVPVFAAGTGPTETTLDSLWYNFAGFAQNGVVLRVSQTTTATTLPDTGTVTTIAYDNVIEDPYSGWSASTHLWTPPAGYSAWYQVTLTIRVAAMAALSDLRPALAGTWTFNLTTLQSQDGGACATFIVYLVGGQDTVGGACQLLNSGANKSTSLTAGQQSTMEIVYVSQS